MPLPRSAVQQVAGRTMMVLVVVVGVVGWERPGRFLIEWLNGLRLRVEEWKWTAGSTGVRVGGV